LEIKLPIYKLSFTNLITPFIVALALEVALSAFINCDSHYENKISLCDSCIFGKFVAMLLLNFTKRETLLSYHLLFQILVQSQLPIQ